MSNFVFGNDDRLRLWDFLNDLGINSKRRSKLCSTIRTAIHCEFNLPIWRDKGSCYSFVPGLLTRFPLLVILISFAITATP